MALIRRSRIEVRPMSQSQPSRDANLDETLSREMAAAPAEPLLPVEKKLISFSLILGVVLLGLLLWLSQRWFPV
jgi:hypothetical protein